MDRERGNKEKTRLTYNCAHHRSKKESETFRCTEEGKYIFCRGDENEKGKLRKYLFGEEYGRGGKYQDGEEKLRV